MPAPLQSFDILLDVVNDTQDNVTVQLERDYGVSGSAVVTGFVRSGSPSIS